MTKDEAIAKLFEVSLDYFKQSDELYEKHLDLKEKSPFSGLYSSLKRGYQCPFTIRQSTC